MPDPAGAFEQRRSDPNGVGPYTFALGTDFGSGSLGSGSTARLDLRELVSNGTRGYFVALSPAGYDDLQVENRDGTNPVTVTINDGREFTVPASATEGLGQSGIYVVSVTNDGGTAISSGDVVVTLQKNPLGADEVARRQATEPPLRSIVRRLTGV